MLGNICFPEQIFYRKQSLGAPANEAVCEVECFSGVKTAQQVLVDFAKVLCSSANDPQQNSNASSGLYSTNIDCFVRDSSGLHLTFVAFCLLSVIRKQ